MAWSNGCDGLRTHETSSGAGPYSQGFCTVARKVETTYERLEVVKADLMHESVEELAKKFGPSEVVLPAFGTGKGRYYKALLGRYRPDHRRGPRQVPGLLREGQERALPPADHGLDGRSDEIFTDRFTGEPAPVEEGAD